MPRLGYRAMADIGAGAPCWGIVDNSGVVFSIALHEADADKSLQQHDRYAPGPHHFAFHAYSRDDVDRFHTFLCSLGVTILDAPAEYHYTPGYYAVFFADPDGLKLEVVFEPMLQHQAWGHQEDG